VDRGAAGSLGDDATQRREMTKSGPGSAEGLGRVKTPTCNLRVEILSRFRQLENQKYLGHY